MKKIIIAIICLALITTLAVLSQAYTSEEMSQITSCKKDCSLEVKNKAKSCLIDYNSCRNSCNSIKNSCILKLNSDLVACKSTCSTSACVSACVQEYRTEKKETCDLDYDSCKLYCTQDNKICYSELKEIQRTCSANCIYTAFNKNITCSNNKYKAGQVFLEGCSTCKFNYKRKYSI